MKPVRLPASATNALPRWGLIALCLLYILPGLIGRDLWKTEDAAGFGIMWTMAHGNLHDWLWPQIVGLPISEGPLAFWLGAISIKLFGWLIGDIAAARLATIGFFLIGSLAVWYTTYVLGRRAEAQPLRLAFGGQPEPKDYGRTLADGALLIYLGSLGLLMHSHSTSANALQVSLVACAIYAGVRFFELFSIGSAILLGITLGLLALGRSWIVPLAIWIGLVILTAIVNWKKLYRILFITLAFAVAVCAIWVYPCNLIRPFNGSPIPAWMAWNAHQIRWPSWETLKFFLKNSIWFVWPAWPFAGWAIYAWRTQRRPLHIIVPLATLIPLIVLTLLNHHSEQGILLPLLPSLAILAAFGLPTMKRGAINAVDWFSVMTLTTSAAFIWIGWIAKQTGWPAQLAHNALKLVPGFKPEFNLIAFVVAVLASISWILLVHWRISRRPSVLWRAVVLSSGGVILCWLLLTTLWLPWINYGKSYAGVAKQLAAHVPSNSQCITSNVGPAQRASFAYFGDVPFSGLNSRGCDLLLLQDNNRKDNSTKIIKRDNETWQLLWEGRRPSDRDERYRLFRRLP
jgi:4-amino-4-deoxy-L-arabinose transferase-like glycosyltransferase